MTTKPTPTEKKKRKRKPREWYAVEWSDRSVGRMFWTKEQAIESIGHMHEYAKPIKVREVMEDDQ